jgi:anti-repressor protein
LLVIQAEEEKEKVVLQLSEAQKQIESDRPKVAFADAVSVSQDAILVGEMAKILKQNGVEMGQNRLFEWLRSNGYLINRKATDYNMPTQYSMERNLFKIKETSIAHSDGHVTISKTPKITGAGQLHFINKFLSAAQ